MGTIVGVLFLGVALFVIYQLTKGLRSGEPVTASGEADTRVRDWLAAIDAGRLPAIDAVGIMPLQGEVFFYQQEARYGQTQKERVYTSGNQALYIPLGHGFRARVGGSRGTPQTITNFVWLSYGTVYVSNIRIVFKGSETMIAPYRQILSYDCYPDGLSVDLGDIGIMQFQTGDEILGTLFQKIVVDRIEQGKPIGPTDPQPS